MVMGDLAFKALTGGLGVTTLYLATTFPVNVYRGLSWHSEQSYLRDYPTFAATARYWTEAFAKSASTGMEEKVQKLVEMGFPEDQVRSALNSVDGDENMALEKLCSGSG
uniref:UBA domain-containing protein n=1 Tax=Zea mays TaxID=4577 RepID=A0A804NCD5_MAIZE